MSNRTLDEYKENLDSILSLYHAGDYRIAGQRIEDYLRSLLFDLFNRHFGRMDGKSKESVARSIVDAGLDGNWEEFNLEQIGKVLNLTRFLDDIVDTPFSERLLSIYSISDLPSLIEFCKNPEYKNEKNMMRLAVQQLIIIITFISYQSQIIDLTDEDFIDSVGGQGEIRGHLTADMEKLGFKDKFFLYNEERGLLLNVADRKRNVAFKAETFGNLLTHIFKEIKERLSENNGEVSKKAVHLARAIIENAGKNSGSRFGSALADQFQSEGSRLSLEEKINKWCDFDSDVGFGRFDDRELKVIDVDENTKKLDGKIKLAENFLTLGRRSDDENNICSFMKGYICGVLEELTGQPLKVTHRKIDCSQFNLGSETCTFHVQLDETRFKEKKAEQEQINWNEEL